MDFPEEILQTYIIEKPIGEGGGGVVYLATHKRLQKKVVLKKIRGEITDFVNCRTEVDILKNLRHSYLPQVIDFIESPEGIFTVMDYIDGESLQQKMDRGYKFEEKEVRKYLEQLCEAVQYLHSQNPPIIHGDIKPDNVMITKDGNVCLIDFNISGFLSGKSLETIGYTPGYSSPEQIKAFENVSAGTETVPETSGTGSESTLILGNQSSSDSDATVLLGNDDSTENPQNSSQNDLGKQKSKNVSGTGTSVIVDTRTDIYSVGATAYAILGGDAKSLGKKTKMSFPGRVSDGMRIIVSKAVEPKVKRRYQSMDSMLEAVKQVQKMDASYRALIRKQHVKLFMYCLSIAIAVILIVLGSRKLETEKEEKYDRLLSELQSSVEDNLDKTRVEEIFNDAIGIHDTYTEPYYYKAYYLYSTGNKDELIGFVEDLKDKKILGKSELSSRIWYLAADSLFGFEKYSDAEEYYAESIAADPDNSSLYRDYAISLVYGARLVEAEKILDEASDKGMDEADIYMVQGELYRIRNNYAEAAEYFKKVVNLASDEQLKLRALVNYSRCCTKIGTKEKLLESTELLESLVGDLSRDNRLLIYEELGSSYLSLGELDKSNKRKYNESAIKTYETIVDMRWANEVTYSNLVVLNQENDNFIEAMEWAEKMCAKYPDSYVSYMRSAFVEAEIEESKDVKKRDYSGFETNFLKAKELYDKTASGAKVDTQMLRLEEVYNNLKEGKWFD
ncbi:MAG: protein kinase [Lachnospiraceae bacterium]|nr:protein kinase [Lachnospiraceae bacterium]